MNQFTKDETKESFGMEDGVEEQAFLYTVSLKYFHKFPINIGDVFYAVESESQTFLRSRPDYSIDEEGIDDYDVYHYTVHAYRICEIRFTEPDTRSWETNASLPLVKVILRPHENYHAYLDMSIKDLKEIVDPDEEGGEYVILGHIYKDYSSVVNYLEHLNKEEEKKFEQFNVSENTSYELESWKKKNDCRQI